MFRKRLRALSFALLLLGSVSEANASPVRLVSGPDYVPYADPTLPSGGLATELVLAAFAAVGLPVAPVQFEPWKRGYADTQAGLYDATFPYVRSPRREAEMLFSDPVYDLISIALFRAGDGHDYQGPASLKGLRLCVPIGYAPTAPLVASIDAGEIELQQAPSPDVCLRQLAEGRVDVFVSAADLVDQRVAALYGATSPFVRGRLEVYRQSLYLVAGWTNPDAADLVRRFNEGLAAIRANGRYDEIVRRQLGSG